MARLRASIGLITLITLFASAVVTGSSTAASASPAPSALSGSVQMNYACAAKGSGLLRYVSSPANCVKTETVVTIADGPIYVCVYLTFLVCQVSAPKDCSSTYVKALTLPPSSAPVYFCALAISGSLTYATSPSQCSKLQTPVVVPVPHPAPVLANLEAGTPQYYAATPGVQITADLTGGTGATSAVESFLNQANGTTPSVIATASGSGGGFTGGSSCPNP